MFAIPLHPRIMQFGEIPQGVLHIPFSTIYMPAAYSNLYASALPLTPADLEMFRRLRIDRELLGRAGIERVTDQEARQKFGLNGTGDNAGIVFPYVDAVGIRRTCRLRRDHPDMEGGKPVKKYLVPYGDRRHAYIVPGDHNLGQDAGVPVVLVEAEKSALALRALADRTGRQLLPIALGG